jgi:DNA-directed RNA polymerase specialized sigma24 family protein
MRAEDYFSTEWPGELPRLRRLVARNGVPADDVDDVLQDAAARLYAAWGRVFDDRPVRPLVTTIVLNAARDHHRRAATWVRPVEAVPDHAVVDGCGVDRVVMARLDVARVGRALAALPAGQRHTVLDAVADDLVTEQRGRRETPPAVRMARSRARRQLVAALELLGAAVGAAYALGRRALTSPATPAVTAVALGVAIVAGVAAAGPDAGRAPATTAAATAGSTRDPVAAALPESGGPQVIVVGSRDAAAMSGWSRWSWTAAADRLPGADRADDELPGRGASSCVVRVAHVVLKIRCTIPPRA